ncbi:MAG: hypothetical protein CL877_08410 [Dehalococcoidales bacterium]|nr:hypothetical protein [Dehalococcoidales bacterium]
MSKSLDMPKPIMEAAGKEGAVWMPIEDSWREIHDTPVVLKSALKRQKGLLETIALELTKRDIKRILMLGSGDSWFASMAVCLAFERYAGLQAIPIQAYEYAVYGSSLADASSAVVIISSSGRPTTTWDALDRALETPAFVIGISDTEYSGNPFLEKPPVSINPGATKSGMPTQTTTVTIGLLMQLALILGVQRSFIDDEIYADRVGQLSAIPDQMLVMLSSIHGILVSAASHGARHRLHTIIGSGPSYAVAQAASALLAEGPQFTGHPLPAEEYHHALRGNTVCEGDPVLLIAPSGEGYQRVLDACATLTDFGAHIMAVVDREEQNISSMVDHVVHIPTVDEPISPLLSLPPVQLYSVCLAAERIAGGYERPALS